MGRVCVVVVGDVVSRAVVRDALGDVGGCEVVESEVWSGLPAGAAVCVDAARWVWVSPGGVGVVAGVLAGLMAGAGVDVPGVDVVVPSSNVGPWPLCGLGSPSVGASVEELGVFAGSIAGRGAVDVVDGSWVLPAVFGVVDASRVSGCPARVGDVGSSGLVVGSVWCHHREVPSITAVMIVKNEAGRVERAIASVAGLVDEVVVYDTGSTDDTVDRVRAAGGVVRLGYWDDDFSRARNEAALMVRGEWMVVVDADEVLVATADQVAELRGVVTDLPTDHAVMLNTRNLRDGVSERLEVPYPQRRLFHRTLRYRRSVHERAELPDGREPEDRLVEGPWFRHEGYAHGVVDKGDRNTRLAELRLQSLGEGREREEAELDVARSLLAAGRREECAVMLRRLAVTASDPLVADTARQYMAMFALVSYDEGCELLAPLIAAGGAACATTRVLLACLAPRTEMIDLLDGVEPATYGWVTVTADALHSLRAWSHEERGEYRAATEAVMRVDDVCRVERCWWVATLQAGRGDGRLAAWMVERASADDVPLAAAALAAGPGAGLIEVATVLWQRFGPVPSLAALLGGPAARGGFVAALQARMMLAEAGLLAAGDPLEALVDGRFGNEVDRVLAALVLDDLVPVVPARIGAAWAAVPPEQLEAVSAAVDAVFPGTTTRLVGAVR